MIPKSTHYQAYCLVCNGGGKDLGVPSSKKLANREAGGHNKLFGHRVIIRYYAHALGQCETEDN